MDRPVADTEGRSFEGGCHCGNIRFKAEGPLRQILIYHCSDCLKLSGTSLGASAAILDHLTYMGTARPRWYRSSSWEPVMPDDLPDLDNLEDGRV